MRDDLLALDPERLAALSNWGLVKRAQKELDAGARPELELSPEGTLQAKFPDGTEVRLEPGKPINQTSCSCGAVGVCRHRIGAILAYAAETPAEPAGAPSAGTDDSPAGVSDTALQQFLGPKLWAKAVKLRPTLQGKVSPPDTALLSTCTVRFLSGARLEHARCDCSARGACEHIALAVWLWRGEGQTVRVSLQPLEAAVELLGEMLHNGLYGLGEGINAQVEEVTRLLSKAQMTWPLLLWEELHEQRRWLLEGNARYRSGRAAWLMTSLLARLQAARAGKLDLAPLLGLDRSGEVLLQQIRLIGLGARADQDRVAVYLGDPNSGVVLVAYSPGGKRLGGLSLSALATGHLMSAAVNRKPNGVVRLGRGPHSLTQVADWSTLRHLHGLPQKGELPSLLSPVLEAEDFRVLEVDGADRGFYSPARQELSVWAGEVVLRLSYRQAAPKALEALWTDSAHLKWVAGPVRREGSFWVMEPTAWIARDRVVAPDFADDGSLEGAPLGDLQVPQNALGAALEQARDLWAEVVHRGPPPKGRDGEVRERLRSVGLERLAGQGDWLQFGLDAELMGELVGFS